MSVNIILDKSTFQSLSFQELVPLNNYYKHNITPVLCMEVLGDLKKDYKKGKPPKERVIEFAKKLFSQQNVVNVHYKKMIKSDLMGDSISYDGRPFLDMDKSVVSESGQKGWIVKETAEEKAIQKWKDGDFNAVDYELSQLWRDRTSQKDICDNIKRNNIFSTSDKKITDFNNLNSAVDEILCNLSLQPKLLKMLLEFHGLNASDSIYAYTLWKSSGKLIKDYAPYAFHCLKVDVLFFEALNYNLIGTRPTNIVDLNYLYYLPFCDIFTSNDKLHLNLAPLLCREDQIFVKGTDLKKDLAEIVQYLDNLTEQEKKRYFNEPPIDEKSITFQIWKKYFNYPHGSPIERNISDNERKMMMEKMKEFEKVIEGKNIPFKPGEKPEFVLKKSYMGKNDPCLCGSGKPFIECCIDEKEFNRLALRERQKRNLNK